MAEREIGIVRSVPEDPRVCCLTRLVAVLPAAVSASELVISCVSARCRLGRDVGRGGATTVLVGSALELRKNGNLMFRLPLVKSRLILRWLNEQPVCHEQLRPQKGTNLSFRGLQSQVCEGKP